MKTFCGVLLILMLGAVPMWAALGEPESTVSADGQFLRGQTDPSGGVIREYVSPAGKVFGISWQGPFVPNMQQLLGTYFTYVQQYAQAQTGRHSGPLSMQKDDFVFTCGGHMRWRYGRAYVPSLLPTNLSPAVVQ
jgi:hypothetical protein